MLDADALADVEGDAALLLRLAKMDDGDVVSAVALCRALTNDPPFLSRFGPEAQRARVGDRVRVCVRAGLLPARQKFLVGHELAEWHYARTGYRGEDIEERCDALGAALVAPRPAFRRAVRSLGHSVRKLAAALAITQACSLLRIGETEGRPVLLGRALGPVTRGEPHNWETGRRHPIRLSDEGRWGLMAIAA
jgi:hypothetical protein